MRKGNERFGNCPIGDLPPKLVMFLHIMLRPDRSISTTTLMLVKMGKVGQPTFGGER